MAKKILDLDWLITEYMPFFSEFGMTEENVRGYYETWSKNRPALIKDYLWFIFQSLLYESAKQSKTEQELYKYQNMIYMEMLWFRRKVEKVKANEILQLALASLVRKTISETNFQLKVEIISGHCCPYCDNLNQHMFSSEEVLKNQYLGSRDCTNPQGCNCTYAFVPMRDEDDNLISNFS